MDNITKMYDQIRGIDSQYADFLEDYFKHLQNYESIKGEFIKESRKFVIRVKYNDSIESEVSSVVGDISMNVQFYDGEEWSESERLLMPEAIVFLNNLLATIAEVY